MYKNLKILTRRHSKLSGLKLKHSLFLLILLIFINIFCPSKPISAFTGQVKNILVLTSYEQNEYWETNVLNGLYESLKDENIQPIYKVEYLAISNEDKKYTDAQGELLTLKYKNTKFDLVIVIDDEALTFFSTHGENIFGEVPVVYGGINSAGKLFRYPYNTYTGVVEHYNINSLIDLMLRAHSNVEQINVILNNSAFSSTVENEIKSSLAYWSTNVKFNFIKDDYLENISSKLKELPSPQVHLLVGNFKTKDNFLIPYGDVISTIKNCSDCSIYSTNGGYFDSDIIGGYVLSGTEHGKILGKLALRVLKGEAPKSIHPVHDTGGMFVFNYYELVKNKISQNILPQNSVIKNQPTFNSTIFYTTMIVLGILIVICIIIIIYQTNEKVRSTTRINYEKKRYEEVLKYDKMKTEFLANISHELRTPLNVMLSGLQLLEMHKAKGDITFKDPALVEKAFYVKQNGYRLLRLINNLIDVTKIDSGFFHLQLETRNIIEVVEGITLSISEYMDQKGINLVFDTNEEELYMPIDSDKIERIMLNLLSNAAKFTPKSGTIFVNMDCSKDSVKISVKDNGIGIPKGMQKEIFNRFTQVDSSLHKNKQGSGIGLSLVKSLVELHKGSIYVVSTEGKGSTFTFELPVTMLQDSEVATTSLDIENPNYNEKIVLEFSDLNESM